MAQILEVTCRTCGAHDVQLDGPVLAGYQPRCVQCGQTRLVPWGAHTSSAPRGLSGEALVAWLVDQAGACSCGGRFSGDAPLRCAFCRSTDVSTTFVGVAD